MDKQTYARYLLNLMDEEADSDEAVIEEAALYGYFQMYMPSGKGWRPPLSRLRMDKFTCGGSRGYTRCWTRGF